MSAINDFLWAQTCLNNSRRANAAIAEWEAALDECERDRDEYKRLAAELKELLRIAQARTDRARRHAAGLEAQVAAQAHRIARLERELANASSAAVG